MRSTPFYVEDGKSLEISFKRTSKVKYYRFLFLKHGNHGIAPIRDSTQRIAPSGTPPNGIAPKRDCTQRNCTHTSLHPRNCTQTGFHPQNCTHTGLNPWNCIHTSGFHPQNCTQTCSTKNRFEPKIQDSNY